MKKHNKSLILGISLMLTAAALVGCGASSNNIASPDIAPSEDFTSGGMAGNGAEFPGITEDSQDFDSKSELEPEKVIVHVNLEFETVTFENSTKALSDVVAKYKAYIENSNVSYNMYYNNRSYRSGYYVIRVPKDSVTDFKNDLNGVGNMISENTSKEDATKHYRDTESRLKVVTTKEARLLELLEKATKIEDIIALENQLTDTIYEKESLEGTLRNIDDQVDYSTFYINITEVDRLSSTETTQTTFGTRLQNAIADSGAVFVNTAQNLIISLIYILPFILVIAIIGYPTYRNLKKSNRLSSDRPRLFKKKNDRIS